MHARTSCFYFAMTGWNLTWTCLLYSLYWLSARLEQMLLEKLRLARQALSTKNACSTTDVSMKAIMYRNMTGSTVIRSNQWHLCGFLSSTGTWHSCDVLYRYTTNNDIIDGVTSRTELGYPCCYSFRTFSFLIIFSKGKLWQGYELEHWGIMDWLLAWERNYSLFCSVQTVSGAHPPSYLINSRVSFPGRIVATVWSWLLIFI